VPVEIKGNETWLSQAARQPGSVELRDLDRALAKLPVEQRTVILLVGLEGMRYEVVGEIMGVPVGTVRSRLSRGRETLRMLMGIVKDEQADAWREPRRIAA
jgi:RNA polymerase sigma-70 factor, ECF subfamily